ncbi:hypothetical protein [Komagataeibacter melaceti]|uniref:hypothetical protein n=1 Tax=Komagataeibacter melaceti TaxID=2766577 RepID=UPI0011E5A7ED|nr:hypothetical protein [Komagataeibacter melaceti]
MSIEDLPPLTNNQIRMAITKVAINSAQAIFTIKGIISEAGINITDERFEILKMNHERLIDVCHELLGIDKDE